MKRPGAAREGDGDSHRTRSPGVAGENLTVEGLDWPALRAGVRLRVGDVVLEVTRPAEPCRKIGASFSDARFSRVSEKAHPGWSRLCAKVIQGGTVSVDDRVVVLR
jgi:MOSC domain-containing protein YiiM